MEIILLERVDKLGQIGDVVKVKDGYARNFLLPRKKALRATEANKKYFEAQRKNLEERNKEQIIEAGKIAKKAKNIKIILLRQAGESGQLYGSVTARDIARAIRDQGVKEVRRGNVILDAPIKELGILKIHIRLHADVVFDVEVNVARSAEEAEAQVIEAEKLFESEELAKAAEEALSDKAEVEEEITIIETEEESASKETSEADANNETRKKTEAKTKNKPTKKATKAAVGKTAKKETTAEASKQDASAKKK